MLPKIVTTSNFRRNLADLLENARAQTVVIKGKKSNSVVMSEDLYNQVNFLSPEGHLLFPEKLTFDDVLLIPEYSEVLPRDTRVHTRISKNIILKIPFISAAMDTVTESRMAVEMALAGGIGIIHKNLAPDEQAAEVKIVKRFENGFIKNPVVLPPTAKISDAYIIRRDVGYKAIPITENGRLHGKLLGILTSNDYFINRHGELLVSERMTPSEKLLTAPEGTSLERAHEILEESKHSKLLIVSASGNLVALVTRRDLERKQDFPDASLDKDGRLLCGAAVGPAKNMEERVQKLAEAEVDLFVVDTAHGHSKGVADTVRYIKKKYPKIVVIGGNIASKEAVQFLKDAGADGVKVGIGPGSICTTRIISGVGMPQFSAILDTAAEAKKLQISLIADGGIKYSGDAVKALAAGADAVMIGSIFAGTEESPGELIYANGKTYKSYRGMGSLSAMKEGGKERYAQGDVESEEKFVPEGIEGRILFKGSVRNEIYQMVGGLKSALGYQGCASLEELHQKAKFIRVTSAAVKESHPHDITISREAPNYRGNYE